MERIRTIIDKEWAEVFKNKMVMFTVVLLPILFTILPLVMLYATRGTAAGDMSDMPAAFAASCTTAMTANDCMQVFISNEFLLFYMIMPLMIPITIAAYSIVGEKATRSLEPLLATPITTEELMAGKAFAAVLPGVGATFACFIVFQIAIRFLSISPAVVTYLSGPVWLLAVFVAGPLMAVVSVIFALMISSRVSDPRVAEQTSAVLLLPLLGVMFSTMAGWVILNVTTMLIFIAALVVVDIAMIFASASLFQREVILTRWK